MIESCMLDYGEGGDNNKVGRLSLYVVIAMALSEQQ